jgi:putative tricarboxylic transport membrane protein
MLTHLFKGLQLLGNTDAITYLLVSSLVGMITGILPGLGGPVLLSIVLAFIYHVSLTGALCIFLAIHAASFFTSSITAILLNTPSHAESFAVTFDGFPMAQRGEAGRALGISAASTCIGGLVGCVVLVGFIQVLNNIPNLFHPPEYVALILIALLLVGTLGTDAVSKALVSMGLGILIASIGQDPLTGAFRYTFNSLGLYGGVSLVALALGLFAIPQMLLLFGVAERVARQDMTGRDIGKVDPAELGDHFARQVVGGVLETFRHWVVCLRAGLVGVLTGLVPGIGAFAANFMSYGIAQQFSKRRELFGTGIPEGIIAPEGSSLAKEAGGLVPLLALGIPGGVGSALFLAALAIKGIHVGYNFNVTYPNLAYEMVWIIAIGGVVGTLIGVIAAPWLARVTKIPGPCLVPCIMALSVVGAYVAATSFFVVMELLVFSLLGLVLRRLRYAIAALVIGLVLGTVLETNIYQTHAIYPGWTFLARPFTDILAALAIGVLLLKITQQRRDARAARKALEGLEGEELEAAIEAQERLRRPYPLLAAVTSTSIFAIATAAVVYAVLNYSFITAIMPSLGGGFAAIGALSRLPGDVGGYLHYRRHRPHGPAPVVVAADVPSPVEAPERERELVLAGRGPSEPPLGVDIPDGLDIIDAMQGNPVSASWPALPAIQDKSWGRHGQYTREVVAFGWFVALILFAYLFGFYVALPLFCMLYALTALRRVFSSMRGRIIFGVITAAVTWGMVVAMFNVIHITFTPMIHLY